MTLVTGVPGWFPASVPLKGVSSVIYPYVELFNQDHYRGPPRKTFQEAFGVVDTVVEFFMTWGEKTRRRTRWVSTQGTDQIIPYCTRHLFVLMHESLVRLTNILTEISADSLLPEVTLTSMVTLMVENLFSLMRKEYSMPTQLEYGIRRASCVRELVKRMYRGQVSYFTGPKNYYPDKVIDACPPTNIEEVQQEFAKLCLEDKKQLREFTASYGQSVRQHTVRDKSKGNMGCLLYTIFFNEEAHEPWSPFSISTLSTLIGEPARRRLEDHPAYNVYFAVDDVVTIISMCEREKSSVSFFRQSSLKMCS